MCITASSNRSTLSLRYSSSGADCRRLISSSIRGNDVSRCARAAVFFAASSPCATTGSVMSVSEARYSSRTCLAPSCASARTARCRGTKIPLGLPCRRKRRNGQNCPFAAGGQHVNSQLALVERVQALDKRLDFVIGEITKGAAASALHHRANPSFIICPIGHKPSGQRISLSDPSPFRFPATGCTSRCARRGRPSRFSLARPQSRP